ncbi:Fn3-like domain-containing protein [Inconstantimicrobium porci]|uniref:S8 family serine peptidase n=1 Tax=Inconstantimicrobium porci TaxID=2652291 RepID=A0A7X2T212_9CLOT|nr:Fn3-like domain-containing protein [Inconstantimicrobium porci]MSR92177.1 S8 family serine peptidase [Inconstantimicrobium porci]
MINPLKLPFRDMQNNAQKAGAVAAVVYHPYQDSYMHMASDSTLKIPALFIGKTDGEALLHAKNPTIEFGHRVAATPNPNAEKMSDYTSWGPTPSLDFAPEVTAPGGNIYSTANNNGYQNMSGTSMAAPHTTGAAALVVQASKDKKLGLSGKDLVRYAKNSLINTTKIMYDKEKTNGKLPYSPRRQGSGLIQVEDAIKNNVLALANDGQATVSLKEIGQNTTFDITLNNYGDKAETYELQNPGEVLTSYVPKSIIDIGMSYDKILKGANLKFNEKEVTVPAKGSKKVTVTLNIDDNAEKENYAEGYIKFKNKGEDPSLVVPFMSYYGSWSKEKIVVQWFGKRKVTIMLSHHMPQ